MCAGRGNGFEPEEVPEDELNKLKLFLRSFLPWISAMAWLGYSKSGECPAAISNDDGVQVGKNETISLTTSTSVLSSWIGITVREI